MRTLVFLAAFFAASLAHGQIEIPAETAAHEPIVARLTNPIPEGAQIQGGWQTPGIKTLPAPEPWSLHVWAAPGSHTLSFRGVWIKTTPITLPDGTVVQVLQGFGFLDETARFTVKGGGPDPGPNPPPPPPPSRLGVVIIEDAEARTSLPYGQVQSMTLPDIRELASVFRLVDKDNPGASLAPWIALAKSYPWLVLHDVDTGRVVWQGSVPLTAAAMRTLLNQHKPQDAIQQAIEQKADPQAGVTRPQSTPQSVRPQTVFGRFRR